MATSKHRNKKHDPKARFKRLNKKRSQLYAKADAANAEMIQSAVQRAADAKLPDQERGLYSKYRLARLDGSTEKGGKHHGCDFFVLDITHDPHAVPAIFSYAVSAQADGFEKLAADLFSKIQPYVKQLNEAAGEDTIAEKEMIDVLPDMDNNFIKQSLSNFILNNYQQGSYEFALLTEALNRISKYTRKKTTKAPDRKAAEIPVVETVNKKEAAVGICPFCNSPVGEFGDSNHRVNVKTGAVVRCAKNADNKTT